MPRAVYSADQVGGGSSVFVPKLANNFEWSISVTATNDLGLTSKCVQVALMHARHSFNVIGAGTPGGGGRSII